MSLIYDIFLFLEGCRQDAAGPAIRRAQAKMRTAGIVMKLKRLERDIFILESQGGSRRLSFHYLFKDAQGHYLKVGSRSRFSMGRETTHQVRAQGEIASADVYIPAEYLERKFAVSAVKYPEREDIEGLKSTRYILPQHRVSFQTMEERDLANQISFIASRSEAMFGFNQPGIQVILPRIGNSAYATFEFPKPVLLDKSGATVPYDLIDAMDTIRFSPVEGDEWVQFAIARGKAKIRYPLEVETFRIKPGENKNRVSVEKHWVYIRRDDEYEYLSQPSGQRAIRAYDKTGRELASLGFYSISSDGDIHINGKPYWGEIAYVEVDWVARWANLELSYELPPAPLRDQ